MKKTTLPANYDLVEVQKITDVLPRGSSFVIFYEGLYDLNDTVYGIWGEEKTTVYFKVHTFKGRQARMFYIPYPDKKENKK